MVDRATQYEPQHNIVSTPCKGARAPPTLAESPIKLVEDASMDLMDESPIKSMETDSDPEYIPSQDSFELATHDDQDSTCSAFPEPR